MENECSFKGCKNPPEPNGACGAHQGAAALVIRGLPPACIHGVPLLDDCLKCGGDAARKRQNDTNAVDAARQGRLDAAMREVDIKLRELQRELLRRDFNAMLGPHGGIPIVTHIGLPMVDGRVYAIRYCDTEVITGAFTVHWGQTWVLTAAEPDVVVLFAEGIRARSRKALS